MDQAHKEQVLAVSELANHKGFKYIVDFIKGQETMLFNRMANDDTSEALVIKNTGQIIGINKVLSFVESNIQQRKDIQPK